MDRPLVSVVIATRDRPELLREAIAAVRAQEPPGPVEVLVVFDQSEPDRSLEVAQGGWRVRVLQNVHSTGLAGARNTGIQAAEGEFVAFCDDDDYWLPHKLRGQVELLNGRPDRHCVSCGITVQYDGASHDRVLDVEEVTFEHLLRDRLTELHPSTLLFRRQTLVDEIGLVSEDVPGGFGEDYELLLRTARRAPILVAPGVGTVVRWHKSSFFFQRWATMSAGLQHVLARHPEIGSDRRGHARILGQIGFAEAAQGNRREAMRSVAHGLARFPLEPRLPLAVLVSLHLVAPSRVMRVLHRFGRGI